MAAIPSTASWHRFFTVAASFALVVAALNLARMVLIPVVLSVLFTFILAPLVTKLQRKRSAGPRQLSTVGVCVFFALVALSYMLLSWFGDLGSGLPRPALAFCGAAVIAVLAAVIYRNGMGRVTATVSVVGAALAALTGIWTVVFLQLGALAQALPENKERILKKVAFLRESGRGSWLERLTETYEQVAKQWSGRSGQPGSGDAEPVAVRVESPGWHSAVENFATPAAELLINAALVLVLVLFMLAQREQLRNRLIRLLGYHSLAGTTRAIDDAAGRISRFLLRQLLVNFCYGLCFGVGAWLIGVPYAVLWGVLAGLLRYVPYLGMFVATALPVIVSWMLVDGFATPLILLAYLLVVEVLFNNVLEPMIYGHSIGASEVALLVSAAFWAWVWGPIGLILSTPMTACLVVLGRYVPQLRFFDVLLGDEEVLSPPVRFFQRLIAHDPVEALDLAEAYASQHSPEQAAAEVLAPALVLLQEGHDRGELTDDEVAAAHAEVREIIDNILPRPESCDGPPVVVIGCPARDEGDALGLELLSRLPAAGHCQFEVTSPAKLFGEMTARIEEKKPAVLLIVTLTAAGVPYVRYLCKRLQALEAAPRVIVGCWGGVEDAGRLTGQLKAAGVEFSGTSISETASQLVPLIQFFKQASREPVAAAN